MGSPLDKFISHIETECGCRRKESLPREARKTTSEISGLFSRITEYMRNLKSEMDPFSGVERPSRGWAYGAFRDAQQIIDLSVSAFCLAWGLHIPRDRSSGVRKSIVSFLLDVSSEQDSRATGDIHLGLREGRESQTLRRGSHAIHDSTPTPVSAGDLVWLRRRVKYPDSDMPHDELHIEIERALNLARKVHTGCLNLLVSQCNEGGDE